MKKSPIEYAKQVDELYEEWRSKALPSDNEEYNAKSVICFMLNKKGLKT